LPRRARLSVPGIPWHIIQRGNNRSACFFAEEDYHFYLDSLKELAEKFDCKVHAYILMTNHVHLLLTPEEKDSASLLMKNLGQRYTQYVNRTYKRTGTLWEGRFRSCLTQTDDYVLACYRYIELNPVRANMVKLPEDYQWSSYHKNVLNKEDDLIAPHDQYLKLALCDEDRRCIYKALFSSHLEVEVDNEIRSATNGNYVLGNMRFKEEIEGMLGRRVSKGVAGRPKKNEK